MIIIGVDVHKRSFTAVAVDEVGRMLDERTVSGDIGDLLVWAAGFDHQLLWAVEDCRQLTRAVERDLLAAGEDLVRVPPKLAAPERRTGRERGKSDPIDALAIARVAVRESATLSRPRPDEETYREMKLLVDHRDDLVDERRRMQQRLRWHLHQLDPTSTCRSECSAAPRTSNGLAAGLPAAIPSCRCGSPASLSVAAAP